jgi:SAM-dependent methyltransferase
VSDCIELADYEWLVGQQAAAVLTDLATGSESLPIVASRLRRQFSLAQVHLLLEQTELRKRAAAKFTHADSMFFTSLGLEQATDQWVARHKAARFAGRAQIADLCCGIGGDLLALAEQGTTIGIDRDPVATHLAAANARACRAHDQLAQTQFEITDADKFDLTDFAAWHLDPDRRPNRNRTTSLEWSDPNESVVERFLTDASHAAIKLAPAADVPDGWTDRCELEWISRDRECRQLVAWHGDLAKSPGLRRATALSNDGVPRYSFVGQANIGVPIAGRLGRFLFEPDSAVLAAHLTGALAAGHGLERVSAGVAYLSADAPSENPALASFEIAEVLPFETRRLAAHLRKLGIGTLEIKKRGVDVNPQQLRRELKLRGDQSATLILTPHNGKQIAILAHRIESSKASAENCRSLTPAS